MTKDRDNENNIDIDDFFKEFEKIDKTDKKSKRASHIPGVIPGDTAPFSYEETNVVANRSERLGKSQKSNVDTEKITDLEDLFGYSERDLKKKKTKNKKTKREENKSPKRKKKPKKKKVWFKRFIALCGVVAVLGIVMVAFILQDTQNIKWDNIYDYLSEASVIYDDDGKEIENIYSSSGNRVISKYDEMPKDLVNAFISIEDKTFWDHHGFNFTRMAGAIVESVKSGGKVGGTSTITQQLARNLWLTETKSERSLTRKIKEAYYAIQLERHLSKEEIVEVYLNTIALGQNCLGVQSASQTYFSKDVGDLTVLESAALASLAKAPSSYSYIKSVATDEVSKNDSRIIKTGNSNTYLYNDRAEDRVQTVLNLMEEQGYITETQHDKAKISKLKGKIKPNIVEKTNEAQFFVDYTIKKLSEDLKKEYNLTEQEATRMVYSGGLKIYTTLDKKMQNAAEKQFKEKSNFPDVTNLNKDKNGNILNDDDGIILYKYSNFFDGKGRFTLKKAEYTLQKNGDLLLKKGKKLNFYETESSLGKDINIEFKPLYRQTGGTFYSIDGGVINIPAKYKSFDSNENIIIDAEFFADKNYKDYMSVKKNKIVIPEKSYTLRQQIQQPQAAMVIMDHKNGEIKAMIGGRSIEGKMNYNRATSTRQPGSAIKPIAVYAPALESGASLQKIKKGESSYGDYWTAASVIRDEYMTYKGKTWPRNWYSGYRGSMSLRRAVEQSVNTIPVKVLKNIGIETSVDFLEDLGVTSIVKEKGASHDLKPAALALGGMSKGISPIEMAAAYATFPNSGTYVEPKPYSEIRTKNGTLVMKSNPTTRRVMDVGTAFIMNDILRTTVTNGIAGRASMNSQPVAGKTGTTSDNFDAWFVGSTPKYTASIWIGNDINIQLSEGSTAAASLWSKVMAAATEGDKRKEFPEAPYNVEKDYYNGRNEYFIDGTRP